ncbi:MAG TPA: hypothetical protein VFR58_03095 [Flavisolibacter sp.]|nr:hypothetical protein [Flavisolibacter sp.]
MTDILNAGQAIEIRGKSGAAYNGVIFSDKSNLGGFSSRAIVCLSNSSYADGEWHHRIKDIYDTDDSGEALAHFRERDDITHLILISRGPSELGKVDKIDDLRRNYIHR